MQSNIFLKMAPLLKERRFNSEDILYFLNEHYKSEDWIYPGAIAKSIKTSIKDIYEILEECFNQGIVKKYFDIYCPKCCKFTGERYNNFIAIPDETFCPHCDNEITSCFEKALIIYKVL